MSPLQPNVTGRKPAFAGEVLWTKHDLARFLNISVAGLQKQIARGEAAPHIRVGRLLRWEPPVVREYYRNSARGKAALEVA
jgi:hypothetical protein